MLPGSNENARHLLTSQPIELARKSKSVRTRQRYQRSARETQRDTFRSRESWRPYSDKPLCQNAGQATADQSVNTSLIPFSRSNSEDIEILKRRQQVLTFGEHIANNSSGEQFKFEESSVSIGLGNPRRTEASGMKANVERLDCPQHRGNKQYISYAKSIAAGLMKYASNNKIIDKRKFLCRSCARIPVRPVTGSCGHTRCTKCIQQSGSCPCGGRAPTELFVDVLARQLIDKIFHNSDASSGDRANTYESLPSTSKATMAPNFASDVGSKSVEQSALASPCVSNRANHVVKPPHAPMSLQVRYKYARRLMCAGRLHEALAQLARVATGHDSIAENARSLLVQKINVLIQQGEDLSRLTRRLKRLIQNFRPSILSCSDLECPLCLQTYSHPVTTPCGHTFCRFCVERLIDYKKPCALCQRPLFELVLSLTEETFIVKAALQSINAVKTPQPLQQNMIYVIACTIAYPNVPCPLMIFEPRYWFIIRRVLESGTRKFGMVTCDNRGNNCVYGTILEVRDCVLLENGSFILSTVGMSRFHVIEWDILDGCDVARVKNITDIVPQDELSLWKIQSISCLTHLSAVYWLRSINPARRQSIEATFGVLPNYVYYRDPYTPDGPAWLWWLIAILPLRNEIKILILSTKCIFKRLMAVTRTLEAMKNMPDPDSKELGDELCNMKYDNDADLPDNF